MESKRTVALFAAAALAVPALGACSSTTGYCDQRDEAQEAFTELRDTNIISEGTDTLQQRYDSFENEVEELIDAAGEEFAEESAAVEASLTQVDAAITSAANLDIGTAASQIGPALDSLVTSSQELLDAVNNACS